MTGTYVAITKMDARAWEQWTEDNPPESAVVRGAAPLDERAKTMLREQAIARMVAQGRA